jgi:hypothetical protein
LDFFGNILESSQLRCGVAVAECVVGDDVEAMAEEGLEVGMHFVKL